MGFGISRLLVAALLGSGAFIQPAMLGNQQRVVSSSKRRNFGWSNRMVQRMATKRRNQKRNQKRNKGK